MTCSRGMRERAVKQRMRSVQNIAKITSAMKMVAASKMRVAQAATEASRGITYPLLRLLGDQPCAPHALLFHTSHRRTAIALAEHTPN